jgi:hypothetical protein
MSKSRGRRIYNVLFVLIILATFFFVRPAMKDWVKGLIDEADTANHDRVNSTFVSDDARATAQTQFYVVRDRIDFCNEHLDTITTFVTLTAYVGAYFFFWYAILFSMRYINKTPK